MALFTTVRDLNSGETDQVGGGDLPPLPPLVPTFPMPIEMGTGPYGGDLPQELPSASNEGVEPKGRLDIIGLAF